MASHIMNDPIHGIMEFNDEERDLVKTIIDTKVFQRLRRIKQLGFADLIYPGANHTRFSHCIGACYLAKMVFEKAILKSDREDWKKIAMVAALIHDIGHGPYSHTFEKVFEADKISHENWTKLFANSLIENVDDNNIKEYITEAKNLILKNINSALPKFIYEIVSSQLDVDRMDYLLCDSYFCGVSYGKYDPLWLINTMAIAFNEYDKNRQHLGINYKGIRIVEHYLMARRFMNLSVYLHKKKTCLEFIFGQFISELEMELRNENITNMTFLEELLIKKQASQGEQEILDNCYIQYKNMVDDDIYHTLYNYKNSGNRILEKYAKILLYRKMPEVYQIKEKYYQTVKNMLDDDYCLTQDKIAIEKPSFKTYKDVKEPIYVVENGKIASDITHSSDILKNLANKNDNPCYLYVIDSDTNVENFIKELKKQKFLCSYKQKESY